MPKSAVLTSLLLYGSCIRLPDKHLQWVFCGQPLQSLILHLGFTSRLRPHQTSRHQVRTLGSILDASPSHAPLIQLINSQR